MRAQSLAFPQTDIQILPIFNGSRASLVFLCEQEPDELGVGHLALGLSRTPGYGPGKDPVNHPGRDGWKRIGKNRSVVRMNKLKHKIVLKMFIFFQYFL